MHYALHILVHCIALWCAINSGRTARSAISPEILANFAKNVASVISPVILGDVQARSNRSFFRPVLPIPPELNGDLNSPSSLDNIIDKTSNVASFYGPSSNSYTYNKLYEDSIDGLQASRASEGLDEESYLQQEHPNFYEQHYRPYSLSPGNFDATGKPDDTDSIESPIGNIEEASSNQYSSFRKSALGPEPFLGGKAYGGFHDFGPYGGFHGHGYNHRPYNNGYNNNNGGGQPSDEPEQSARQENNGTNRRAYGPPFGHGFHHSPFFGGGYHPYYGPHRGYGNDSNDGNGYGPYHGGPDFYGPPGYGYNHGYNGNNNGNNNNGNGNNRQTEEPAGNGNQNNSSKNGYPHPYGPPFGKPFLGGGFHHHGFPYPFHLPPYDHFQFKGGLVGGVGHVGYPVYADPYLIGFPFHYPYGPFYHGNNKYLPPKSKPSDTGEQTEAPAGEITGNEEPERITALSEEEIAPAPSSNRYKTSERKGLKRVGIINFESRKV